MDELLQGVEAQVLYLKARYSANSRVLTPLLRPSPSSVLAVSPTRPHWLVYVVSHAFKLPVFAVGVRVRKKGSFEKSPFKWNIF